MGSVEQRLTELERRLAAVESERTALRGIITALGRAASTYERQFGHPADCTSKPPPKPDIATAHSPPPPDVKTVEAAPSAAHATPLACSCPQPAPTRPHSTSLYVQRLVDGQKSEGWLLPGDVKKVLTSVRHDLFVDEPKNKLIIRNQGKCTTRILSQLPPRLQDMLWLTLVSAGGNLSYRRIAEHLHLKYSDEPGPLDELIHQIHRRLRRDLLGPLAGQIFPKGKNREYLVLKHTWSFCWIRCEKDPGSSVFGAHHGLSPSERK